MKIVVNVLLVIGVCVAALGAAGFHNPAETGRVKDTGRSTEVPAWPLFVAGMVLVAVGGAADRIGRGRSGGAQEHKAASARATLVELLARIRDRVIEIDEQKADLTGEELCRKLDDVLSGDFFDLIDKREDLVQLLGFRDYAKVWDGVATAERLLNRVWSIATDGHRVFAIQDLPQARQCLSKALDELSALWPAPNEQDQVGSAGRE
ncbi:MAG: hypothetical protein IID39_10445 [Planctomycetes bacterium]|nr:hypothetical protein [Planctomycetota bacterium]